MVHDALMLAAEVVIQPEASPVLAAAALGCATHPGLPTLIEQRLILADFVTGMRAQFSERFTDSHRKALVVHARYLLPDVGGVNVEAGFSAEGAHQKVQPGLLSLDLAQNRLNALVRTSAVYDLVGPVLEVKSDGAVRRICEFEHWARRQALGLVGQRLGWLLPAGL